MNPNKLNPLSLVQLVHRRWTTMLSHRVRPGPFTIVIGAVHIGGAGKTPFVMALVQDLLKQGVQVGVLLRGYQRRAKDHVLWVSRGQGPIQSVEDSGDEAWLIASHCPQAKVVCSADRIEGAQALESDGVQLIICDDGYQHIRLKPDLSVVMLPSYPSKRDSRVFPWGHLRENLYAIEGADIVFVEERSRGLWIELLKSEGVVLPPGLLCTFKRSWTGVRNISTGKMQGLDSLRDASLGGRTPITAHLALGRPDVIEVEWQKQLPDLSLRVHRYRDHAKIPVGNLDRESGLILFTEKDWVKVAADSGSWRHRSFVLVESVEVPQWFVKRALQSARLKRRAETFPPPVVLSLVIATGKVFGWVWLYLLRVRRTTVEANLKLAFGSEMTNAQLRRLLRKNFWYYGRLLVETMVLPVIARLRLRGIEISENHIMPFRELMAKNQGALLLTAHLGNWEFNTRLAEVHGVPLSVVTKEFRSKLLHRFWFWLRQTPNVRYIGVSGTAYEVIRSVKEGRFCAMMLDQHMEPPVGVVTQFFGTEVGTIRSLALLSLRYQIPVIPVYVVRNTWGRYECRTEAIMYPPKAPRRSERDETEKLIRSMTNDYCAIIEKWVRAFPDQWNWLHRRFKYSYDYHKKTFRPHAVSLSDQAVSQSPAHHDDSSELKLLEQVP